MDLSGNIDHIFNGTLKTDILSSINDGVPLSINNNYTLPFADGEAGQVFGTDGAGTIGFVTLGGGLEIPQVLLVPQIMLS